MEDCEAALPLANLDAAGDVLTSTEFAKKYYKRFTMSSNMADLDAAIALLLKKLQNFPREVRIMLQL